MLVLLLVVIGVLTWQGMLDRMLMEVYRLDIMLVIEVMVQMRGSVSEPSDITIAMWLINNLMTAITMLLGGVLVIRRRLFTMVTFVAFMMLVFSSNCGGVVSPRLLVSLWLLVADNTLVMVSFMGRVYVQMGLSISVLISIMLLFVLIEKVL